MKKVSEETAEKAIAFILRYGSQSSTLVMALGLGLSLWHGLPPTFMTDSGIRTRTLLQKLSHFDTMALTELGVLLLLFTPVLRILVAMASFALEREYRYVLISLGVLAVVLLSIGVAIEI